MARSIRIEATVLAALILSILALVLALQAGGSDAVFVTERVTADGSVSLLDVDDVPDGALEVDIVDFAYDPDPISVIAGQEIVWRNEDLAPHSVTAVNRDWDSGMMQQGDTVVMRFAEPGVYTYFCTLHPPQLILPQDVAEGATFVGGGGGMQGKVIVNSGGK